LHVTSGLFLYLAVNERLIFYYIFEAMPKQYITRQSLVKFNKLKIVINIDRRGMSGKNLDTLADIVQGRVPAPKRCAELIAAIRSNNLAEIVE
jgi:hypothetical protein